MTLKLSDKQILNYKNDGVILIEKVFLPWIGKLKNGFPCLLRYGTGTKPGDNKSFLLAMKFFTSEI